jgi:hypothetical protein
MNVRTGEDRDCAPEATTASTVKRGFEYSRIRRRRRGRARHRPASYPRKRPWSSLPVEGVSCRAGGLVSKSVLHFRGKQPNSNVLVCLQYSLKPREIDRSSGGGQIKPLRSHQAQGRMRCCCFTTTERTGPIKRRTVGALTVALRLLTKMRGKQGFLSHFFNPDRHLDDGVFEEQIQSKHRRTVSRHVGVRRDGMEGQASLLFYILCALSPKLRTMS